MLYLHLWSYWLYQCWWVLKDGWKRESELYIKTEMSNGCQWIWVYPANLCSKLLRCGYLSLLGNRSDVWWSRNHVHNKDTSPSPKVMIFYYCPLQVYHDIWPVYWVNLNRAYCFSQRIHSTIINPWYQKVNGGYFMPVFRTLQYGAFFNILISCCIYFVD